MMSVAFENRMVVVLILIGNILYRGYMSGGTGLDLTGY